MRRKLVTHNHFLGTSRLTGLLALTALCHAASTGQITGTVQTIDGTAVAGASVAVLVRPPLPQGVTQLFNSRVTTAADGTFSVTAVPQGRFAICVTAPGANLLAPCLWGAEPVVTLNAGENLTLAPIQLRPGVDFQVRVNDPTGKQAAMEGTIPGASLMLAVRSPVGIMVPMLKTGSDATGTNYHLSVPAATPLVFLSFSQVFQLTDSVGSPADPKAGLSQTIDIPTGQSQYQTVVNIQ